MRNEHEMLELIANTAKSDDRIRAVIMNGEVFVARRLQSCERPLRLAEE